MISEKWLLNQSLLLTPVKAIDSLKNLQPLNLTVKWLKQQLLLSTLPECVPPHFVHLKFIGIKPIVFTNCLSGSDSHSGTLADGRISIDTPC